VRRLSPVLNLGRGGIQELTNKARENGAVMSQESAKAAREYAAALKDAQQAGSNLAIELGGPVLRAVTTPPPRSGIYMCTNCGDEAACNKGDPLPPQDHRQYKPSKGRSFGGCWFPRKGDRSSHSAASPAATPVAGDVADQPRTRLG
jgi:hypothetical protein